MDVKRHESTESFLQRRYPEMAAGGFTRWDGTIQFYNRVNALIRPDMEVLDFGCGRGALSAEGRHYERGLANLRGKVRKVVGVDVEDSVLENVSLDEAVVYDGARLPFEDQSFDLIVADYVFEHLSDPATVSSELLRVLRPGGWLCARTPYLYSLLALTNSVLPPNFRARFLHFIQKDRKAFDIFRAYYRLNSQRAIIRYFPRREWELITFTWSPEPSYHGGSAVIFCAQQVYQSLKRPVLGGEVLMMFLNRRVHTSPKPV